MHLAKSRLPVASLLLMGAGFAPAAAHAQPATQRSATQMLARAETLLRSTERDLSLIDSEIHAEQADQAAHRALTQMAAVIADLRHQHHSAANARPIAEPAPNQASGGAQAQLAKAAAREPQASRSEANNAAASAPAASTPAATASAPAQPAGAPAAKPGNAPPPSPASAQQEPSAPQPQAPAPQDTSASTSPNGSNGQKAAGVAPTPAGITPTEAQQFVGMTVHDPQGESLGTLQSIVSGNGGPRAVIAYGGFLGLFQSHAAIPWDRANPRVENGNIVFNVTPSQRDRSASNDP